MMGELDEIHELNATIEALRARVAELEAEVAIDDKLLNARDNLLKSIPECPEHGNQCIPHAMEWVEKMKAREADERAQVAEALIQWAAEDVVQSNRQTCTDWCPLCLITNADFDYNEEPHHKPDCLHLRAKALRDGGGWK